MIPGVSATRMELLRLKKRYAIARRGHKLLKDKLEQLMVEVLKLIDRVVSKRRTVEKELKKVIGTFQLSSSSIPSHILDSLFYIPKRKLTVSHGTRRILNIQVPIFSVVSEGETRCYGFYGTDGDFDTSIESFSKVIEEMIELAQLEKTVELLAREVERTRRRVNALEYILIPELEETIAYIKLKLSEMERGNITRLMRVKEVIGKE